MINSRQWIVKFEIGKFSERLKSAALKAGIVNVPQFADLLKKKRTPIPKGTIQNHYYGVAEPPASTIAIYAEALGVTTDFLITGKEQPPLSLSELKAVIGRMLEEAGGKIPDDDPVIVEIAILLNKTTPEKRKAILTLVKQMTDS